MKYTNTIALIQSEIERLEHIIDNRIRQNYRWSDDEKERQISLIRSDIDELKQAQSLLNSESLNGNGYVVVADPNNLRP